MHISVLSLAVSSHARPNPQLTSKIPFRRLFFNRAHTTCLHRAGAITPCPIANVEENS